MNLSDALCSDLGSPGHPREVVRQVIREILVPKVPPETGMDDEIDAFWNGQPIAFTRIMMDLKRVQLEDCHYLAQGVFKPDPDLGVGLLRIPVGQFRPTSTTPRTTVRLSLINCSAVTHFVLYRSWW